jgi:hypothetical protein
MGLHELHEEVKVGAVVEGLVAVDEVGMNQEITEFMLHNQLLEVEPGHL